ncbi:unnamed protein product [Paramecium sonneborni]|uniref:Uncharacterized protein n=1 Tax=Paramecium sonneborni TaxID=65129 RepID=A0A8S1RY53_9CILI|nr:unnamed protein product [Paramecium sonneborni]
MKIMMNILKQVKDHDLNNKNYCEDIYEELRKDLIKKISKNDQIVCLLKFLVQLTTVDETFIQCGSNGLNLLVGLKVDLTKHCFEGIRIKKSSLIGGNFAKYNFSGSEFENVDISGVNLNGALLLNCKWKNIKIHELNQLNGHTVYSVCFSPDGITLASGSHDQSIRLWDVKTGQQKAKFDGHTNIVYSIYFSTDGSQSVYGILRVDNQKPNWMVIATQYYQYASHQMELLQHQVVMTNQSVYGMLRQDNKKSNLMVIVIVSIQQASHQMELFQYPVVLISQSVYGMLRQDNKKPNFMVILILSHRYLSHQMELFQLQVVMISQFVYGMLKQDNKQQNYQMFILVMS